MDAPAREDARFQGVQKASAGYRLLASMGWREGEGLGRERQGIREHIRVRKNHEQLGVGAAAAAERARSWTTGMADYHRVLSTLSEITSRHASKGGDDGDGDGNNDGASDASGGEPAAAPPQAAKAGKKRKRKVEPAPEPEPEAPRRAKPATHLGRFKRRESAKMVSAYSAGDLAAILGGDPFAGAAAAEVVAAARPAEDSSSSGGSDANEGAAEAPEGQQQDKEEEEAAAPDAGAEGAWWRSYFTRSRQRLGAAPRRRAGAASGGAKDFSEQDQTDLYAAAQGAATAGRVGLGRAGAPKKVGGARWAGSKKRLGSDDDEEEEAADGGAASEEVDPLAPAGIVILAPKQPPRRGAGEAPPPAAAAPAAGADPLAPIRWKRAVRAALAGGRARVKLRKVVAAALAQHRLDAGEHAGAGARALSAWLGGKGARRFAVDGAYVLAKSGAL